jgi:serine protease
LSEEFVAGEVIVTLKATSGPVAARQKASAGLEATYGLRRKAGDASREMLLAVPESASAVIASRKPQMSGERERGLAVPAELQRKLDTLRYLKLLQSDPNVMTASLNRIVRASAVPNDPGYSLQRWHYELLELPAAWNVTKGSANVVVAVVDSGVVAHPDLVPNLTDGFDFVSNPTNQDGNGIDAVPDDPGCVLVGGSSFHGTHVAGTVSATTSNAAGVAGVGWNTRLMPVRVLDGCSGSGTSYDVAQGIRYAAGLSNDSGTVPSKRADVINLSLGSAGACDPASANLAAAVRAQGVVVVAAAGNDNTSVQHSPASCPNVISVSAVGPTPQRAPYSNYGASWVDVAAPGGDMRLDANGDGQPDGIFSTHARGGGANRYATFELMQGTSMAAPHIAGVIALMKAVKPSLTPGEVDSWLAQGLLTNDIGVAGRDDLGAGLISAAKAVQAAGAPPPVAPPTLTVTPSSLSFGDVGTQAQVVLANSGGGALSVTGIQTSAAWIGVAAAGAGANGLGTYQVTVTRGGLAAGTYSGWVDFSSSAGTRRLSILMQVTPTSSTPEAGRQYVLLLDPQSGDTLAEARVNASGESVAYRFDTVGTGQYLVVAGTDMNNDGYVCDDGEACGAYPVLSRPDIVSVAGERSAVDFSTAFQTNLQAASTAGSERKPAGFQRKP